MIDVFASYLKYLGEKLSPTPKQRTIPKQNEQEPLDIVKVDQWGDPLADVSPTAIQEALSAADSGDPRQMAILSERMIDRGGVVSAHWQTRRNAVSGCDWDVVAIDEDNEGRAKEIRKMLDMAGIANLIPHLQGAQFYGYSASLTEWAQDGTPIRFIPVHPSRVTFDLGGNPALCLSTDGSDTAVSSMQYGQAVFCHPGYNVLPFREGLCRSVIYMWLYWRDAWLNRARHLDKYGSPPLKLQISKDLWLNKADMQAQIDLVIKGRKNNLLAYKEGGMVDALNFGNSSNTDFSLFLADTERVIVQLILGQEATAGKSNGMSNGNAQENVRMDIVASDVRMIEDAVKRQIIAPLIEFKYGKDMMDAFEFKLDWEPDEDMVSRAAMVKTLSDAGYKADKEWVSETFNIPLSDDVEEVEEAQPPQGKMAMSDSPRKQLAAQEEFTTRVTEAALRRLFMSSEAMAEFYRPLRDEISLAFNDLDMDSPDLPKVFAERADRFFSQYPSIRRQMVDSSDGFQKVFQGAILTAATGEF